MVPNGGFLSGPVSRVSQTAGNLLLELIDTLNSFCFGESTLDRPIPPGLVDFVLSVADRLQDFLCVLA